MDLKNPESFRKKLMNTFCECLLSTIHGFPSILRSKNLYIKIMWILFCVVSTGLCAFMACQNIMNFFKYEVTTKTRIINQYKNIFPTVTICNMNFFISDFSVNFSKSFENQTLERSPFSSLFEYDYRNHAKISEFYEESKELYGDTIDKLLVDCYFDFLQCDRSQFKLFFHPNHGNCFQFNSGFDSKGSKIDLEYSTNIERTGSLRLILNLSVPDSLKFLNPNSGSLIFIHNQTTYPMLVSPATVAPKTETNIALSRTFYELETKPYSDCDKNTKDPNYFESKAYKLVHKYLDLYSQISCYYQCFQIFLIQTCGCYDSYYPNFVESTECKNKSQIDFLMSFFDYENDKLFMNCFKEECPKECAGMWFDKTVSINHFSTSTYQKLIQRYGGKEKIYLNKNGSIDDIAIVNIYYESFGYTQISESPTINFTDLLSSIGGIGGLFLGIKINDELEKSFEQIRQKNDQLDLKNVKEKSAFYKEMALATVEASNEAKLATKKT
ncbi:amiloride-sensitive sodium channel subunit gamma [Brachionus plicatilis]|uniref:Amiloride-sensitive sodium channel subunit gamma n=1 Tax=Brachionus plicatilis TaxID=10195 RepID=A0A3M7PJ79_BRAPC|nr:amiloride-sensitive sodium channel subunit gamma [Brachionus plicatilis]